MKDKYKDILYNGLPAVWDGKQFLVFSSYTGEIVALNKKEIKSQTIKQKLEKENFFGKPCIQRGNPKIIRVVLIITNQCRLRCKYCYVKGGESKSEKMDLKIAISAIKVAYKEKKKSADSIEILFFGGEPTLNFGLIQKATKFVKELPLKHKYLHLNVDGLLDKEKLDWLVKEKFFLSVSCDGPPEMQNFLRPTVKQKNSAFQVEQTVKHLVNKKALFSIRATITNYNVSLSKLVNYFADLGVKFLHFEKVVIAGRATNKFIPDTEKYIEEFKKALKLASQKKIYLITSPLMNLFFPSDHFCVQLTGEKYIFTPQGKIILCYFKEMEKFVKIGKIINDKLIINKKKKQKMLNLSLPDDCEDCAFKFICSGGCPADNLLATGSFKKVDKELCKINKAILHETIIFLYEKGRTQKFLPVIGNEILERLRDNY